MTTKLSVSLYSGDNIESFKSIADNSIDSIVTDPPYGLEFMGKDWDAPWKTDRRQTFDGTLADDRNSPFKRQKVRYGNGASYGADAKLMQAFQKWNEIWAKEAYRVLKPGGHLISFSGSRTYHRTAAAIEDAGFEIRDQIMWLYGTGFPKSLNVGKATAAPAWEGWGTALKPAHEPIVVARKPLDGTVAANVLKHGVGGINVDGCRVGYTSDADKDSAKPQGKATARAGALAGKVESGFIIRGHIDDGEQLYWSNDDGWVSKESATHFSADEAGVSDPIGATGREFVRERAEFTPAQANGRFPANVIHDGSEEVEEAFAAFGEKKSCMSPSKADSEGKIFKGKRTQGNLPMDAGTASRFFYSAKATKADRAGSKHPTVKPIALMRYLTRLVTPKGGTVLDPFAGSGTTGQAAVEEGFNAILMERESSYASDIEARFDGSSKADFKVIQSTPPAKAPDTKVTD